MFFISSLKIYIEPFKQFKLGVYIIVITSLFIIFSSFVIINFFISQYQHVMDIFNISKPGAQWDLIVNDIFYRNAFWLVGIYLLYIFVMLIFIFKVTHRYYGPLVGIKRFINNLIKGDYSCRVSIRKNDELQYLVQHLNQLAETLEKKKQEKK